MIKILFDLAVAVVTYIFADKIVNKVTGKHIHQHVFGWWCEMRESVLTWLNKNKHLNTNRIAVVAISYIDNTIVQTKKIADKITITISAVAGLGKVRITPKDKVFDICTREVPLEEALKMFPGLSNSPMIIDPITI